MTAGWNDLPPEIRLIIIDNLDFVSRLQQDKAARILKNGARLSACAKTEQQLVRSNPFKLDELQITLPYIFLKQKGIIINIHMRNDSWYGDWWYSDKKDFLENEHLTETVKKIFESLGTKCIVGKFTFYDGFMDTIEWFREIVNFSTNSVYVCANDETCEDIEPFINWPKNVQITLECNNYLGPVFERLDKYDNIVAFINDMYKVDMMDTKLMKLSNCTLLNMWNCDITIDGFLRWIKKWLVRDDYTELFFCAVFTPRPLIKVDEMKNGLGDFLIDSRKECKQSGVGSEKVFWYFFVRNKLNGRLGRIRLDKESIRFVDIDEVQQCLNSLETIRISP